MCCSMNKPKQHMLFLFKNFVFKFYMGKIFLLQGMVEGGLASPSPCPTFSTALAVAVAVVVVVVVGVIVVVVVVVGAAAADGVTLIVLGVTLIAPGVTSIATLG